MYTLELLILGATFIVWIGSVIALITVRKSESDPAEKIKVRKNVKNSNIALIISITVCTFMIYSDLLMLVCIGISIFCGINSFKLYKMKSPRFQQLPKQESVPLNQAQSPNVQIDTQQQNSGQSKTTVQCSHCGAPNKAGNYFCEYCGKKI